MNIYHDVTFSQENWACPLYTVAALLVGFLFGLRLE